MALASFVRRVALAAVLGLMATPALAAEAEHPPKLDWPFAGPFGSYDQASVQRGFQVYKEVCAACHTLDHLSYRNLGEKGGPFVASGKFNPATGSWEDVKLGPPHHGGRLIPAADNPYVRALAAEYQITEIDPTTGQETTRPGRPSDKFVSPYTNPFQAKATHGVAPPDLSVITKARYDGANYVHAILTGYTDPPAGEEPPGGAANLSYNRYFPGYWISMAAPLSPERVIYADGTEATVDQMARDVVAFLSWAADPKETDRRRAGFAVLIYLAILTGLLYVAYRQVWRNVKH
ncbi:MAG: cytochrome c1 [Hyphomonadaceae bacterium]|nr:cytochrome c1 [Hyphomonadaceae bacterium]